MSDDEAAITFLVELKILIRVWCYPWLQALIGGFGRNLPQIWGDYCILRLEDIELD